MKFVIELLVVFVEGVRRLAGNKADNNVRFNYVSKNNSDYLARSLDKRRTQECISLDTAE